MVFNLIEKHQPTHLFAAQDLPGPTWRHQVYERYKADRPPMPNELRYQLPFVFDFFDKGLDIPLLSKESFEADDIICTLAEHYRQQSDTEVLILSADQDLFQLAGENVTILYPKNKETAEMGAAEVEEKLGVPPSMVADYKGIAGDNSDKLTGVPGIGPKGAVELLKHFGSLEACLERVDEVKGKKAELLREHGETARHIKKLATLHHDLELEGFCEQRSHIMQKGLPSELLSFLEGISSRRLQQRAEKIFGTSRKMQQEKQVSMF